MQNDETGQSVNEGAGSDFYSIGDMARHFNVTLRALRFYEDRKLIQPVRRGFSRYYDANARNRLQLILRGKHLGFTLMEISEMLESHKSESAPALELSLGSEQVLAQIALLQRQRAGIESAIADLKATHDRLAASQAGVAAMSGASEQYVARAG